MSALPSISSPIFTLELPSTKEKIRYRQFSVKEEKALLIAQESDDLETAIEAIKQVVDNCIIDKNVSDFAMFDLEYILLLLRSKSVNNSVSFAITDPDTDETVELQLNLDDVKVTTVEEHSQVIKVNDEFSLYLKYPTIDQFSEFVNADENDPLVTFNIMVSCLDKLASSEDVYDFNDYTEDEISDFMNSLDGNILAQFKLFFETMPKLRHEMKYENSNGDSKTFVLEGMKSFFI